MKQFEAAATAIVRRIVEDEDEDSWKDVTDLGQDDYWSQIGGDANPWGWGGTWYNAHRDEIIHFRGLDDEDNRDIDYREIEVPEQVAVKIKARVHDLYLDTPEAQEDPEWLRKMLFSEEMEIDRLSDLYKIARAEFLNNRKPRTFYRRSADFEPSWEKYELHSPTGLPDDVWQQMSIANKVDELCGYFGWDEYASSFKMTYKDAQALLGKDNI